MAWLHTQAGLGNHTATASVGQAITPSNANDLVIIMGISVPAVTISISDIQGWTFTEFIPLTSETSIGSIRAWYAKTPNTTANTITITHSAGTGSFAGITIDEFSGSTATSPFDLGSTAGSTSTTAVASVTPSVNNCLIWEGICDNKTAVATPYSIGGSDSSGDLAGYKFLSTGTAGVSQSTVWGSGSGGSLTAIASFKISNPSESNFFPLF